MKQSSIVQTNGTVDERFNLFSLLSSQLRQAPRLLLMPRSHPQKKRQDKYIVVREETQHGERPSGSRSPAAGIQQAHTEFLVSEKAHSSSKPDFGEAYRTNSAKITCMGAH